MLHVRVGVLVDRDGSRGVRHIDDQEALLDAELRDSVGDAIGDFYHFISRSGLDGLRDEFGGFHGTAVCNSPTIDATCGPVGRNLSRRSGTWRDKSRRTQ